MTKVVSIVPGPSHGDGAHQCQGTTVLLDNGETLQGVQSVTLKADASGGFWRAIIEVTPTNQQPIKAVQEPQQTSYIAGCMTDPLTGVKVAILKYDGVMTQEMIDRIKHEAVTVFNPMGIKVLVIDHKTTLEFLCEGHGPHAE